MSSWPHAPLHAFNDKGTYIVTAGTFHKEHYFKKIEDLDYLHNLLLELARKYGWNFEVDPID